MSHPRMRMNRAPLIAALLAAASFSALTPPSALAQDAIFAPGEPIVTGFSGVVPPVDPPDGADPLDYTFIDLEGASARILRLQPEDPPEGQLIPADVGLEVTAADIGQVFSLTLDNANELEDAAAPNIYFAATTAFGVHLVTPDADGNPMRTKVGGPEASFMPGQWGAAGGETGYPGSIWKIDGETGEVSLFTTIGSNSGAGLGDIVYDPSSSQFFVSDLDTGLIYRLDPEGVIVDSFDHGVDGRPAHELDPVEDDGSAMDISDPAFSTEDPATWGFAPPERKVIGLATRGGRLFYTVNRQVWSVRINADGSFGAARWELDAAGLLADNEITDILFDPQGRMVLAERGPQMGSYDYSVFAQSGTSSVVRYEREFPADDTTPSTWVETPESYAIGFGPDGANASGGIALGPRFNPDENDFSGACDAWLWASGDALRDNLDIDDPLDPPTQIHGLQGNSTALVLPGHVATETAFFADFDGNTDDDQATAQGHVGGVAIWNECTFDADSYVDPVLPFDDFDEGDDLEVIDDDDDDGDENLTLEKWSSPHFCFDGGANWHCNFTIRVENTGDEPYWGPVVVDDELPDNNPGATMDFWPQPIWHCNPTGATSYQCATPPILLYPGDGIVLHEEVTLPKAMVGYCELVNAAELDWFWDDDDDSSDDFDIGVAGIPAPGCVPPGGGSDLVLHKTAAPFCFDSVTDWTCVYAVEVVNAGPDNFTGPITITDTLGVDSTATILGPWACAQAVTVLTCNIIAAPVNVPPGWSSGFWVSQTVPKPAGPAVCELENRATITTPAGGTPTNVIDANDDDDATSDIPEFGCLTALPTDLEVTKTGLGCDPFFTGYACEWQITVTNIGPGTYNGPFQMKDVSGAAVFNTLTSLYPAFCTGGPASVTCETAADVSVGPGGSETFTFHTLYEGGPAVCSANNNISILAPNPGSPQNPAGNDSVSVGQAMPNPVCAPFFTPKLNIQKTATGCGPDPGSENWRCTFDITVLNYGGAAHPGPITVMDHNAKPTTFSGAVCAPPGGAGFHFCTRPGPLAPGASWTFEATTVVNPNSVSLADCHVINTVAITAPPSGGDPGYFSQADQKVPMLIIDLGLGPSAVYCDPPSLELTKTHVKTVKSGDGYDSTFVVRATSMGPDAYIGEVVVNDRIPQGATFVSSTNWNCEPLEDNDVQCISAPKTIPVGKYTEMTITMHIPASVAKENQCKMVNVVEASIPAEVLHADEGVQYTASADAGLPASACREAPQCPAERVMPGGKCCDEGTTWNGKQCAEPREECPDDSHLSRGKCVCDDGTEGKPGSCKPIQSEPICPRDSKLVDGECQCLPGTEGRPGRCEDIEDELTCPNDSRVSDGECVCRRGTEGIPGKCKPIEEELDCPRDSREVRGECVCDPGTHGKPGNCEPDEVELVCPDDSRERNGECVCRRGTEGIPGDCRPIEEEPVCPKDSRFDDGACRCLPGTEGRPGRCRPIEQELTCPDDSRESNGTCVCRRGTEGTPGNCRPIEDDEPVIVLPLQCPDDSHFDQRRNRCVCNRPLRGEPGKCVGEQQEEPLQLTPRRPRLQLPTIN